MSRSSLRRVLGSALFVLFATAAFAALPGEASARGGGNAEQVCAPDKRCKHECGFEAWKAFFECRQAGEAPRPCWRRASAQVRACIEARCGGMPDCERRCSIHAAELEYRCLVAGGSRETCRSDAQRAERACILERCEPCVCPRIYAPVCGEDGRTYPNACEANCAGVRPEKEGPCCEPVACDLFCEFGFETGPDGCEVCECNEQPECRNDLDCGRGEVCELGGRNCDTAVCVPGCHEAEQCGENQVCQRVQCVTCPCPGLCVDLPPEPECRNDLDCGAGEVCELGGRGCDTPVCVPGCHEDDQCGFGQTCQRVQCVTCPCPGICTDGPPDPACQADSDCPSGEVCELGGQGCSTPVCVPGCHTDDQCGGGSTCHEVLCVTCPCPGLCFP